MNYLSAENLTHTFGEKKLFQDISFGISQGEKFALVGANGAGKSTFMKILGGVLAPDRGVVRVRKGIKTAYLPQDPELDLSLSVMDNILGTDNEITKTIRAYEHALAHVDEQPDLLQDCMEAMDQLQAWDYESRLKELLFRFGITDLEMLAQHLSGGQRKRVAFARLLLEEPDLLLMDEPTNHLDIETIEWLEQYLKKSAFSLLMITHDRYFLESITDGILELDKGTLYRYQGSYAQFLEKKNDRIHQEHTEVDKAQNLMRKELEWMRRQPKARTGKAQYRIDAFHELKEVAEKDISKSKLNLQMQSSRQGNQIIEVKNLGYEVPGKKLVDKFNYIFLKTDRIGVVGKNGLGKSTFLNLLAGKLEPQRGEIIKGETTKVGYFTQINDLPNENVRLIDDVKQIAEFVELAGGKSISIGKFLEMFLFPPSVQYTPIQSLSGGEKKRLQLLKLILTKPNFFILDEPTNDLDLDTLNVLQDFLETYQGTLVIVSHDRYFLDQLVDRLFVFTGDGVVEDFTGNYTDYRQYLAEQDLEVKPNKSSSAPSTNAETKSVPAVASKKKLSFKEQQEFEKLEADIERLEAEKKQVEAQLASPDQTEHLTTLSEKVGKVIEEIELKTLRWLELSEV